MVNILSDKDIPLTLYPFLQLHHLTECQAVESLLLNLEKTLSVKTDVVTIYPNTAMVTHLRFSAYSTEIVTFKISKNICIHIAWKVL